MKIRDRNPGRGAGAHFERFYRVDKSHSKETGGTGLGLSIVKHGAVIHNIQIRTDSEVGKGTTITLSFLKGAFSCPIVKE